MYLSRTMFFLPLCLVFLPCMDCYCSIGNPGWKGPPVVEQMSLTSVRVSWNGLVTKIKCADNFIVKYWPVMDPSDFTMTSPMSTDTLEVDITGIRSRREYEYQMIAREDKGIFGIDYNKSKTRRFQTWSGLSSVAPHVPAPTPQQTVPSPSQSDEDRTGDSGNASSETLVSDTEGVVLALGGMGVEVLVGIVMAGLVILLIMVGILYNCHKRRRNNKDLEMESNLGSEGEESDSERDSLEFEGEEEEEDSPFTSEKESLKSNSGPGHGQTVLKK